MQNFRSLIYNGFFFSSTAVTVVLMALLLAFPRVAMREAVRAWSHMQSFALKVLVGLDFEVRGREHLIDGPVIYAAKHQSAWDTFVYFLLLREPSYVLKIELLKIPFWGWCARKCRAISVDRDGGASALKKLVADVRDRLAGGFSVIIFPEGIRTAPGRHRPFHPGIAALYSQTDAPIVPVAVNSGLFWGRRSFSKHPGRIVIEFLPPIERGLKRKAFMETLEKAVDSASDALIAEGVERFPDTAVTVVRDEN